jgi:predicted Ser/Thr protein kinase
MGVRHTPLPEVFGRYRILRRLGRGGMGTVYLAQDTQLDRPVALKVPHFAATDGPKVLERFYREARAAATLSHPNICPAYDVGEVNGTHYLTMAYVEGKPLSEYLQPGKSVAQRQAAALVRKLALALHEAHARGVIHRDLKPANVMINQRREPIIMDFGLARRLNKEGVRLTKAGSIVGTPAYMAPEQVSGDGSQVGPGCDIYSLGVILYELLTGRLPFDGPLTAVLVQVLTQAPVPPSKHRPDLDAGLEAICLKAMAKKIEERHASMSEFAQALADYLRSPDGGGPGSKPALKPAAANVSADLGPVEPPAAPAVVRRRLGPGAWITAAGAAALVAVLGIALLMRTEYGTVRIELSDPQAKVEVQVDGTVIDVAGLDRPVRFQVGERHLHVSGEGYETKSERFTVRRGENPALKVALIRKEAPAVGKSDQGSDFYARGVSGEWEPMRDSAGQILEGLGACLSSDGRELFLPKRSGQPSGWSDIFLARRRSVRNAFDPPVRQRQINPNLNNFGPLFGSDDLEIFFVASATPQDRSSLKVFRATRPARMADFGTAEPVGTFAFDWVRGISPDGRISFLKKPNDPVVYRAVRTDDGKSRTGEATNLPPLRVGVSSPATPVASANDGALVFAQDVGGKIWLAGARPLGNGAQYSQPTRLFAVGATGKAPLSLALSADCRVVIGSMNGELIALRLPESVAHRMANILGRNATSAAD